MKIVRIIARLNVGGPARHVVWLTQGLEGEFATVLVTGRVPPGEEDMGYVAEAAGVAPVFIEEMSRELSLKDVLSLAKIYQVILREKPDIIHTHTAKAGTLGRIAAFAYRWLTPKTLIGRPRRVKVVHTFHGHVFHSYYGRGKTFFFILIEKLLARFVTDRIITISGQQFDEIHRKFGIGGPGQFAVIPLGIDHRPYLLETGTTGLRRELAIPEGTFIVGFVGRLTEIKNIPLLIEAASLYARSGDPALPAMHLVIAGEGHLRPELEAAARQMPNITFLGSRPDIEKIYSGVDAVALASLNEGTPLSLIEAMASRRPVISTLVGGVVDLLGSAAAAHDGFTVCERGIGVEPGNAAAFAKGLIYLAKNERLRRELSDKGHEYVLKNYGKERLIEDIRRLYRGLLGT